MLRLVERICFALLLCGAACERSDTLAEPSLDAGLRQDMSRWGVIPIGPLAAQDPALVDLGRALMCDPVLSRSEEHTSELQSHHDLVCRLLLEKKKNTT